MHPALKATLLTLAFVAFVAALVLVARAVDAPPAPAGAPPASGPPRAGAAPTPPLPPLFVQKSDVDTAPIALAGPRAKPLLLHLWASWCGPCREELPSLLAVGRRGRMDVMAVSVDDRWPDVVRFFAQTADVFAPFTEGVRGGIPREVTWDPKVTLEPTLGVRSLPTTFLVDKQGRVVARLTGAQDWTNAELRAHLEELAPP